MDERKASSATLGLFFAAFGALAFCGALAIPASGFVAANDPGPRALPQALSLLLIAGGTTQMFRAWRQRGRDRIPRGETIAGLRRPAAFLAGLAAYLILLPRGGFLALTPLFAGGFLWALGHRWWVAAGTALAMTAAVHVLFGTLFKVQLPPFGRGG